MKAYKRGGGGLVPGRADNRTKNAFQKKLHNFTVITVLIKNLFKFTPFFKLQKGYTGHLSRTVFLRCGVCQRNSARMQGMFRE